LRNPSKLYPENTNLIYSSYLPLTDDTAIGKVRETFALSQLQNTGLSVHNSEVGDFKVEDYLLEVGGPNKSIAQIKDSKHGYVFADGSKQIIPLYLLGFLY
jgi:hypothetical protein